MTECEEIAANIPLPPKPLTWDQMRICVQLFLAEDESSTIINNVTDAMMARQSTTK